MYHTYKEMDHNDMIAYKEEGISFTFYRDYKGSYDIFYRDKLQHRKVYTDDNGSFKIYDRYEDNGELINRSTWVYDSDKRKIYSLSIDDNGDKDSEDSNIYYSDNVFLHKWHFHKPNVMGYIISVGYSDYFSPKRPAIEIEKALNTGNYMCNFITERSIISESSFASMYPEVYKVYKSGEYLKLLETNMYYKLDEYDIYEVLSYREYDKFCYYTYFDDKGTYTKYVSGKKDSQLIVLDSNGSYESYTFNDHGEKTPCGKSIFDHMGREISGTLYDQYGLLYMTENYIYHKENIFLYKRIQGYNYVGYIISSNYSEYYSITPPLIRIEISLAYWNRYKCEFIGEDGPIDETRFSKNYPELYEIYFTNEYYRLLGGW